MSEAKTIATIPAESPVDYQDDTRGKFQMLPPEFSKYSEISLVRDKGGRMRFFGADAQGHRPRIKAADVVKSYGHDPNQTQQPMSGTWKTKDADVPIVVIGLQRRENDEDYLAVEGSDTGVPRSEIEWDKAEDGKDKPPLSEIEELKADIKRLEEKLDLVLQRNSELEQDNTRLQGRVNLLEGVMRDAGMEVPPEDAEPKKLGFKDKVMNLIYEPGHRVKVAKVTWLQNGDVVETRKGVIVETEDPEDRRVRPAVWVALGAVALALTAVVAYKLGQRLDGDSSVDKTYLDTRFDAFEIEVEADLNREFESLESSLDERLDKLEAVVNPNGDAPGDAFTELHGHTEGAKDELRNAIDEQFRQQRLHMEQNQGTLLDALGIDTAEESGINERGGFGVESDNGGTENNSGDGDNGERDKQADDSGSGSDDGSEPGSGNGANNVGENTGELSAQSLNHSGDTIWDHVEKSLRNELGYQPTNTQVHEATQRVLDVNGLSWGDARHLSVGYDFKMPPRLAT